MDGALGVSAHQTAPSATPSAVGGGRGPGEGPNVSRSGQLCRLSVDARGIRSKLLRVREFVSRQAEPPF